MPAERVAAVDALVDILEREDVAVVFGIPGGPLLPLYDRLASHPRIRLILVKHEQAAAYAAFAWAKATGRTGVCVATLGPGATNLLAGLPVALVDGVPVLAITGQVQTTAYGHGAHQESTGWFRTPHQQAMFAATCKHSATCDDASRLPDFVRHSFRIATEGRPGPAHLIIPANILHQEIAYTPLDPSRYRMSDYRPCDAAQIAQVADEIERSAFPVLLVGGRARLPDAGAQIESLAEAFAIPVLTDFAAKSAVSEFSPVYLGCLGVLGHRAGERYLKDHADLVVAVGQTFNEISTLSWDPSIVSGKRLAVLDTDPLEVGKVYPPDTVAVGHLPTIVERLAEELRARRVPVHADRAELITRLRKRFPLFDAPEMNSTHVPLLPQRLMKDLREGLPEDAIILADSSKSARWLGRYFPAYRGTIVTAHDYEPMGWAVAGAVGAKLAHPDRPVVCLSGDGAFLMSAMEVSTAVNHGIDVIWVVMADERLGIIYDLQKGLYGGGVAGTTFKNPDFVGFAESLGARGATVSAPDELVAALRAAISGGGSCVIEARIDADEIPPVRPRSLLITAEMGLPAPKPGPETVRALIKMLKER